ncbi:MAG TPA: hypothetical protein VHD56_02490 [Tepidisphaeraceae bacterium]|nr:hypothetical protein [Tepidisphaeraceae bacterium]
MKFGRQFSVLLRATAWFLLGVGGVIATLLSPMREVLKETPGRRVLVLANVVDASDRSVYGARDSTLADGDEPLYVCLLRECSPNAEIGQLRLVRARIEQTRTGRNILRGGEDVSLDQPRAYQRVADLVLHLAKDNLLDITSASITQRACDAIENSRGVLNRLIWAAQLFHLPPIAAIVTAAMMVFFGLRLLRVLSALLIAGAAGTVSLHVAYVLNTLSPGSLTNQASYAICGTSAVLYFVLAVSGSMSGALLVRLLAAILAPLSVIFGFPPLGVQYSLLALLTLLGALVPAASICLASAALSATALNLGTIPAIGIFLLICAVVHRVIRGRWLLAAPARS